MDETNEELPQYIFVMGLGLDKLVKQGIELPDSFKRISELKLSKYLYEPSKMEIHELISESIDSSIYRYAERKSIEIGKIETILKSSAVDRYLYKDLNVIHKNDISHTIMSPSFRSKDIRVNLYDKPYSKICSWSNECDYNQSLVY